MKKQKINTYKVIPLSKCIRTKKKFVLCHYKHEINFSSIYLYVSVLFFHLNVELSIVNI